MRTRPDQPRHAGAVSKGPSPEQEWAGPAQQEREYETAHEMDTLDTDEGRDESEKCGNDHYTKPEEAREHEDQDHEEDYVRDDEVPIGYLLEAPGEDLAEADGDEEGHQAGDEQGYQHHDQMPWRLERFDPRLDVMTKDVLGRTGGTAPGLQDDEESNEVADGICRVYCRDGDYELLGDPVRVPVKIPLAFCLRVRASLASMDCFGMAGMVE